MTKILVIEDETLLRGEVMEWLALEDYEVLGAADGVEGVNMARTHLPDVILCDIAMPHMDGYEVMFDVRANPLTQLTPFIFMTARTAQEDIRMGMSSGADDYITKPFTYQQVIRAVHAQLEKKALQEVHQKAEIERWRQALEKEQELRLLKSKMIAMFSHDFRNPLAAILSSVNTMRIYADRMDDQRRLKHFIRAEASVKQLMQMLDDMLAIAQVDSGNLSYSPELLNLSELFQQVVEEFRFIDGETHLLTFTSQYGGAILADRRLLRQIMVNLISNALKYSPQGSEVKFSLQNTGDHLELTFQDHGIGIPESDLPRMFTTFQRGSNTGSIAGTGLGLAIVKQAVDLHGGRIDLESKVGVGTTFTVILPCNNV
jgi:two-component system, sensor histidine kinase and response regulator